MSNATSKKLNERDADQIQQSIYNQTDASITASGWITAQVGNKITQTNSTTSVSGDTVTFSYFDKQTTLLYSIKLIFTDGTQTTLLSAERTA